jgi:drug/metabolite transporter (DMT)-like permease
VAGFLGFFLMPGRFSLVTIINAGWLPFAFLIGFLFVVMFYLIGISSKKAGIVFTAIATRMSMVFPIAVSLFFFDESITLVKILKICLTLLAVFLAVYKKPDRKIATLFVILPFILFVGSGSVDSLVKVAQHNFIPENEASLFSSVLFFVSFVFSFFLLLFEKKPISKIRLNTLIVGLLLGVVNFGSLFFIILALSKSGIDSSLVFGINNLSIVILSLVIGFLGFREKLSRVNWVGIVLSVISVILLMHI